MMTVSELDPFFAMSAAPPDEDIGLTSRNTAPQHGPRPLPLFLAMLRSETTLAPQRRTRVLAGVRAYQQAARPPARPAKPAVARAGRARLRAYGGTGPAVVFVPSLINPPDVLDLAPGNSLLEWLAGQGFAVFMVDWGTPTRADRTLDLGAHVAQLLVPLLAGFDDPPHLAGYCLGGTLAAALATLRPALSLALIAAPWRFSGFPDPARAAVADLWRAAAPLAEQLGMLPIEVLQAAFWQLDPARTIAKFERFGALDPHSAEAAAFVRLEDWANAGAPLPLAAARELAEGFFAADLPGRGEWQVCGRTIDPAALGISFLDIASATDRIVPAASACAAGVGITLAEGHVGMVVGRRARVALWEPLARWLSEPAAFC